MRSSSARPGGSDPTLLFTNAGMVQFKSVFLGEERREYVRATTCQKCVRAGGKHNDLENVGPDRPAPHVLRDARQLLLRRLLQGGRDPLRLGVPHRGARASTPSRLIATVYTDDDDAFALWKKVAGLTDDRILRLGEKDNFWAMGDTGPCGSVLGGPLPPGRSPAVRRGGGGPVLPGAGLRAAIGGWRSGTSVFMQFNRDASGAHDARCPSRPSTPAWGWSASPR